jgi:hypothetical protein
MRKRLGQKMMIISVFVFLLTYFSPLSWPEKEILLQSDITELIRAGKELYENGDYKEAIIMFLTILTKTRERVPPVKTIQVTSGQHRIKFILKDYTQDVITEETQESVLPGETKRVHHKFENIPQPEALMLKEEAEIEEPGKAWLIITAFPYAKIEIDGKTYREVPPVLEVEVAAGKHTIKFIATRLNKTHLMEVSLSKGERKELKHRFD